MKNRQSFQQGIRRGIVAWVFLCSVIGSVCWAEEANLFVKIPVVTGEWPPVTSETLEDLGFYTVLVSAIFKEMQVVPEYKFYPWKRCELLVQKGDVFAAFPYANKPERAKLYLFSDGLLYDYPVKLFFYKKQKSDFVYERLEDLRAYRVAGIAGYGYLEDFKAANIHYLYADTEETALRMLVAGRVDLVAVNTIVALEFIERLFPNEKASFGVLDKPAEPLLKLGLIVSKTYPNAETLLEQFNAAFQRIVENGTYAQFLKKYGIEALSVFDKPVE